MIKATSVHTTLIDDISLACKSLKEQLDNRLTLLSNSVGIVQCDPEFLEAGIMEPLSELLDIPLVGGTTVSIAATEIVSAHVFSILVITSDEVEFVASGTAGLMDDYAEAIRRSMKASLNASEKPLKMALVFPTVTNNDELPGDIYIETIEEICGDVPVFGTLSVDDSLDQYDRSMSVYNKEASKHELSYVLFFGDVNPRFFVASVPIQTNVVDTNAVITRADGQIIYEVNNVSVYDYFESVGFASDGKLTQGVYFLPLLLTVQDPDGMKRTFVRAILDFAPDGSTTCRGKVVEGATITFGSLQAADILKATSDIVAKINQEKDVTVALFFSCLIRRLCIGSDHLKELAVIKDSLRDDIPFMASYSGGEICPVGCNKKGEYNNSFHNYSLVACLL
jgi:hypothetical protein